MCCGRDGSYRMTGRNNRRHCPIALRLVLCSVLVAHGFPVRAQTVAEPGDRLVLNQLAPSSLGSEGERGPLLNAQFMPGMPPMPAMPPMMMPRPGGTQGSMGGGMTMVMTGDTMLEMAAGSCTAGLFIGGVAAAVATAPAAPLTGVILSSAGLGCGFAVAASAAGVAGMMGARALAQLFK
jgi:hypothetical protein